MWAWRQSSGRLMVPGGMSTAIAAKDLRQAVAPVLREGGQGASDARRVGDE
jgi:hypothetical protein